MAVLITPNRRDRFSPHRTPTAFFYLEVWLLERVSRFVGRFVGAFFVG
jgi:hypothetical protein